MTDEPLTYGRYLRVPELLSLQTPLSEPEVEGELLFILSQQAQELWFKQVLQDLRFTISAIAGGELLMAVRYLDRVNRIVRILTDELTVLETLPPAQFQRFRQVLRTASGLESTQFREIELASGLDDPAYLRLAARAVDVDEVRLQWPMTLRRAFCVALEAVHSDAIQALVRVYSEPDAYPQLYALCEALTDYDLAIAGWRFHHRLLVERVIGPHSSGTAGSPGGSYLARTVEQRMFPELWEARDLLSARP